jgi:hypothetical protein
MEKKKSSAHRKYKYGGVLRYQNGYTRKDRTFVKPHFKTFPDSELNNNRKSILGY